MILALVTGTRTDERAGAVTAALDALKPDFCVLGDAAGVDLEAKQWCDSHGVDYVVAFALWKAVGRPAGPRRNGVMVGVASAVASLDTDRRVCVAVPAEDSVGTYDCAAQAEAEGFQMVWV